MTLPNAQNDAVDDDGADPDVFLPSDVPMLYEMLSHPSQFYTVLIRTLNLRNADAANVENLPADVEILSKCSKPNDEKYSL